MGQHAVLIVADGRTIKSIAGDLESIQAAVGGYIELVPTPGAPFVMFVNEEGKLQNLPSNQLATELASRYTVLGDGPLVGNAVLVGPVDEHGDNADFTMQDFWPLFPDAPVEMVPPFGHGARTMGGDS